MMNVEKTFREFCTRIHLWSTEQFDASLHAIAKKLNRRYYDSESETDHLLIVGSIGRETAVKGVSDVDVIFSLPWEVHARFDKYKGNGQSALLQEVKEVIAQEYSRTEIASDGQVVAIDFDKYTIELVPGFENQHGSFTYPDTNEGGSWKITKPIPEQRASKDKNRRSNGNFSRFCNMIRVFKDNTGFVFGGLLIDTLVADFFDKVPKVNFAPYSIFPSMLSCLFKSLSEEDPEQAYWFALGSNQQVEDKGKGAFVRQSKHAHALLSRAIESGKQEELEQALSDIFGRTFTVSIQQDEPTEGNKGIAPVFLPEARHPKTEQFIEDLFPVDIRGTVSLDCRVKQNGFRPFCLSEILKRSFLRFLSKGKHLTFFITDTSIRPPYEVYWKVRNVGPNAVGRERGQIVRGRREQSETTSFSGPHYVDCYIVKNGVCVARTRIEVPINIDHSDVEHKL
jgi:hypothetical protein